MSTHHHCTELDDPDETRFVRFCGRTADEHERTGARRDCLEFGTVSNFHDVCAMLDMGLTFTNEFGEPCDDDRLASRATLEQAMVDGDVRFGQFPCVVAAGSESQWRMSEER